MEWENKITLVCPRCRGIRVKNTRKFSCSACDIHYSVIGNMVSFIDEREYTSQQINFYKQWQQKVDQLLSQRTPRGNTSIPYAVLRSFFRKYIKNNKTLCLLYDYFGNRRDFFFKDFLKQRPRGLILDLGCGRGFRFFTDYGHVVGLDFNLDVLGGDQNENGYFLLVHCDSLQLPFKDGQFDYLVSSDFLEHIPESQQGSFYKEMRRVLKQGGEMAHFVTTDSENIWFKFAHRYPDLFKKYLVEEIGGHYGLSLPHQLIRIIERQGFKVVSVRKMLWEPVEFVLRFDNEYSEKSRAISLTVGFIKALMRHPCVFALFHIPVGIVCRFFESSIPLDYSNKMAIICEKIEYENNQAGKEYLCAT